VHPIAVSRLWGEAFMKSCRRCGGLMCPEDLFEEPKTSRQDGVGAWRCIVCGEIIDQVIVLNRCGLREQRHVRREKKPPQPVCSTRAY